MKSGDIKNYLLRYYVNKGRCLCIDEYGLGWGIADLLVLKELKLHEIEIKVSIADLRSELNAIKAIQSNDYSKQNCNKIPKLRYYMNIDGIKNHTLLYSKPNKFSYAVPLELYKKHEEEIRSVLDKTPFGILIIEFGDVVTSRLDGTEYRYYRERHYFVKKPTIIHKEIVNADRLHHMTMGICYRYISMRDGYNSIKLQMQNK